MVTSLGLFIFSRGSLFETKYWINRAAVRNLIKETTANDYSSQLSIIARQLNALAAATKKQRGQPPYKKIGEDELNYATITILPDIIFNNDELHFLKDPPIQ